MDPITHLIQTINFFNTETAQYFDPRRDVFEDEEREERRSLPVSDEREE